MKVGIISDSPSVTTGFGVTTDRIARGLTAVGHEVVCLGLKALGETFDRSLFPFKIWTVGVGVGYGQLVANFLDFEKVDVILINMDIFNVKEFLHYLDIAEWRGPIASYLILDGFPVYREYLDSLSRIQTFVTDTYAGARYLGSVGIPNVGVATYRPDPSVFASLSHTVSLREDAGLADKFVVGVFGRNTERKQQVRVLLALAHLKQTRAAADIIAYFHCHPRGFWHLDEIAFRLGVEDHVIFADGGSLNEVEGVAYRSVERAEVDRADRHRRDRDVLPTMPRHYSYVERMNCCDVAVNVPLCGGFEFIIVEAQACGTPLAATDDHGIMAEALGDGGIALEAADVGIWKHGQPSYNVSPGAISRAILAIKSDRKFGAELRARGFQNLSRYPLGELERAMVDAIERL